MIRIARIDNVSAIAFQLAQPAFPVEFLTENPTRVYRALAEEACDAALLSVACIPSFLADVEPLGAYGIACTGAVHSVVVDARYPLGAIVRQRRPVYATAKSQTARRLFHVLCRDEHGAAPRFVDAPHAADACLWIGEDALDSRRDSAAWPEHIDLGRWWNGSTGLPFVFARWMVRRRLSADAKNNIARWLEECVCHAASKRGQERMLEFSGPFMPSRDFASHYYRQLRHRLTPHDLHGMKVFLNRQSEERWNITA